MLDRRSVLLGLTAAAGVSAAGRAGHAAAGSRIRVARPADLDAVLARCTGGEVLELAPGAWPTLQLRDLRFAPPVTLEAADPANPPVIGRLQVQGCTGLLLAGLAFKYAFRSGDSWRESPFTVANSQGVSLRACAFTGDRGTGTVKEIDISGAPWANGPSLRDAADCHLIGVTSTGFRQGMVVARSTGCSLQSCRIEGNGNDNLRLVEVSDLLVERNYLGQQNAHPDEPFHNDHIHHFNSNATTPSERVTIRRNILYSDRAAIRDSAGMMLQNQFNQPLRDWTIEENVVIGRANHGISLWPCHGAVVRRNTLIRWHLLGPDGQSKHDYKLDTPRLNIRKGCKDVLLEDNIVAMRIFYKGAEVTDRGNVVIPPVAYASAFEMPDPQDPRTWRARRAGPAEGKGSPLLW